MFYSWSRIMHADIVYYCMWFQSHDTFIFMLFYTNPVFFFLLSWYSTFLHRWVLMTFDLMPDIIITALFGFMTGWCIVEMFTCWSCVMWCMMATVHIPLLLLLLLLLSKNHMTVFPFFTGLMTLNVQNSKRNQRAFKIFLYYHDNNNDNDDISVMFLIYPTTAALKYIKMWKYVKCFFLLISFRCVGMSNKRRR